MAAKVGIIPNADGSAMFAFGNTIAIAAVYGPRQLHPQHMQNPSTGILRCNYDLLSFSVYDRKRPGPSRRSQEISKVTEWSLLPAVDLTPFPNTVVDVQSNKAGEKAQSYMREEMAATAESKGRNPDIAMAMVDESLDIDTLIQLARKDLVNDASIETK